MVKNFINPDLYHGWNKKTKFFEGWYFKLVDAKAQKAFAFIPGIHLGKTNKDSHCFIQILQGKEVKYKYLRFSSDDFVTSKNNFHVSIKDNYFSLERITLDISDSDINIKGSVTFKNVLKWPDALFNPGSMGFYNFIPFLQCYSQVCVMDMDLEGNLHINGKNIDFNQGKGYIEKNWGKAFPYSWIWIQSNNFSTNKTSLSCSLANIPLSFFSFRGFLIGLYINGIFYSFTTVNRSQIQIHQKGPDIDIQAENKQYVLNIQTQTLSQNFMLLNGPRDGKMIPLVRENLQGEVHVSLREKKHHTIVFCDIGFCTGIEYGGRQMLVLD